MEKAKNIKIKTDVVKFIRWFAMSSVVFLGIYYCARKEILSILDYPLYLFYYLVGFILLFLYSYVEIDFYNDRIKYRKPFWFFRNNFEIHYIHIKYIYFTGGRDESIKIKYIDSNKVKTIWYSFNTFRTKELYKAIDEVKRILEENPHHN